MNSNKNKHSKEVRTSQDYNHAHHTQQMRNSPPYTQHWLLFLFLCLSLFIYYCTWTRTCMEPAWSLLRACLEHAWISLGAYDESAWSLLGVYLESTWIWRLLEFSLEDTESQLGFWLEPTGKFFFILFFSRRHLELGITTTMITSQATTRDQLEILPRIAS